MQMSSKPSSGMEVDSGGIKRRKRKHEGHRKSSKSKSNGSCTSKARTSSSFPSLGTASKINERIRLAPLDHPGPSAAFAVPLRLNDLRHPVFFMDHSPHACLYISIEVIFRSRCVFISSTTYYPSIAETEGPVLFGLVSFPRPASPTPASIPPSRPTGRFVRSYDLFMARAGSPAASPAPP
ncbi:hypothetical protein D9757_013105 [Collybiopsis confluens]|uniref:Uncharacterized protein n=1 Tax=Collybiopsis confluens TaxID=2823264 RepID=A0A8H5FUN7_9AGAR|nr:hypothetical protein D9757_013105 [Collybiopsis confluens]